MKIFFLLISLLSSVTISFATELAPMQSTPQLPGIPSAPKNTELPDAEDPYALPIQEQLQRLIFENAQLKKTIEQLRQLKPLRSCVSRKVRFSPICHPLTTHYQLKNEALREDNSGGSSADDEQLTSESSPEIEPELKRTHETQHTAQQLNTALATTMQRSLLSADSLVPHTKATGVLVTHNPQETAEYMEKMKLGIIGRYTECVRSSPHIAIHLYKDPSSTHFVRFMCTALWKNNLADIKTKINITIKLFDESTDALSQEILQKARTHGIRFADPETFTVDFLLRRSLMQQFKQQVKDVQSIPIKLNLLPLITIEAYCCNPTNSLVYQNE